MKYYTPELEEFHVGFEYEEYNQGYQYDVKLLTENPDIQLQILSEPELVTDWVKCVYELDNFISLIDGEISTYIPEVRVKYLDEQDIKDLGWEFTSTNGMVMWFHGKEEWFGKEIPGSPLYKYWSYTLTFDSKYQSVKIECGTNNGDTDTFFEGIIKNKSELRKLMTQLGILQ